MANIRDKAKAIWLKGMEAVGNTAANIANNTKMKVDEVTLQNRRREIMNDLAGKTYNLWLKGVHFPEELTKMLNELQQLDDQLNDMRAAKYASSVKTPQTENMPASEQNETAQEMPEPLGEELYSPVSNEINGLFDNAVSVDYMAQKVNFSLAQMSDRIRSFPQGEETDNMENRQE